jgi:curli biogenesis system outer membrane secretion channel CsgG
MQIVDRTTGEVVQFEPGQVAELDLVKESVTGAVRLGIGLGRTSAQSAAAMTQGMEDAIFALKTRIRRPQVKG